MTDAPITPAQPEAAPMATRDQMVDIVTAKVAKFIEGGELHLPENYSASNALKGAWLILQETEDRNKRPVLEVCTKPSIANALLNMVVQGLNAEKKQGYFIAYGDRLVFQRSYFGAMAVAQRVDPTITDISAQPVYDGDEFEYGIVRGRKVVTKHVQKLENINRAHVVAAYCTIVRVDPNTGVETEYSDIMTMDEIKQAWKQSQMRPVQDNGDIKTGSTHEKFAADMACKTVINHAVKAIVNASDDSDLLIRAFKESDQDVAEAVVLEEVTANANAGEIIDVPAHVLPAEEAPTCPPPADDEVPMSAYDAAPAAPASGEPTFPDDPAGISPRPRF